MVLLMSMEGAVSGILQRTNYPPNGRSMPAEFATG
jgi:hypothetical protein